MDTTLLKLHKLPLYEVFKLALEQTGKSFKEACSLLGWSESHGRRILSAETYYPSADKFPVICQKLGNTLLLEWMVDTTRHLCTPKKNNRPVKAKELPLRATELMGRLGDVAERIKEAVADNELDPAERAQVTKVLRPLVAEGISLIADLKDFDDKQGPPACA